MEATKYTEVGYVGRDVESMVRDLVSVAVSMVKAELSEEVRVEAERRAEEALLDLLLPGVRKGARRPGTDEPSQPAEVGPEEALEAGTGMEAAGAESPPAARNPRCGARATRCAR